MACYAIHTGDALEVLRTMPDESVQCCVTSPPYWGLRDYGVSGQIGLEETPEAYVARIAEVFRGVRRVLRDDGTLWLNLGDSYAREGGKTSGVPRHWDGRDDDPGGLHDKRSLAHEIGLKPKDLIGIPWMVAFALRADGWYLRSDIIWAKPNPMPESVTDRPTKAHEYVFLMSKSERYYYDSEAIREASVTNDHRRPTTSKGAKDLDSRKVWHSGELRAGIDFSGRNARSVWTIVPQQYNVAHFATFPEELPRRCIRAGSRPGDTILDPFTGSGTTGKVALEEGREFVGIELNPEYVALAHRRIAPVANQLTLDIS